MCALAPAAIRGARRSGVLDRDKGDMGSSGAAVESNGLVAMLPAFTGAVRVPGGAAVEARDRLGVSDLRMPEPAAAFAGAAAPRNTQRHGSFIQGAWVAQSTPWHQQKRLPRPSSCAVRAQEQLRPSSCNAVPRSGETTSDFTTFLES